MFWPTATRVAIEQQDHPTWKGKLAPTNGQGLGIASRVKSNVELFKREQSLASNYYACLSPPPCQVKAHLVLTIWESWVTNPASGFYVGNAWDHYQCHEIYISDTRHTQVSLQHSLLQTQVLDNAHNHRCQRTHPSSG
jgi:hypothetical protein